MSRREWTADEVARMTRDDATRLRESIKNTLISADDPRQRRGTMQLLNALNDRLGATVEDRAAAAKSFLHPTNDDARERAFAMASELYGSEREAIRRGYSDPRTA